MTTAIGRSPQRSTEQTTDRFVCTVSMMNTVFIALEEYVKGQAVKERVQFTESTELQNTKEAIILCVCVLTIVINL